MPLFEKQSSLQQALSLKSGSVGFVPTMGALHAGHLSLIEKARSENEQVVVSIFVNPTQFDQVADLDNYPRLLEADIHLIERVDSNILVFAPEVAEVYGHHIVSDPFTFEGLDQVMEGNSRVGHFQGVATVVDRLLRMVNPDTAYFGEKDYQQLLIVRKMVTDKKHPVKIVGCPIVREKDGLAMSSRNLRLSPTQRKQASLLYKALVKAQHIFQKHDSHMAHQMVTALFKDEPKMKLDYFIVCDATTLQPVSKATAKEIRGFIAVQVGDIRLIDNLPF